MTAIEFGYQLSQHESNLYGFAYSLAPDKSEARDLVQETYLKALTYRDKFRPHTNFKAWLFTIMKNTFINQYRRKKYISTVFDDTDESYLINKSIGPKSQTPQSYLEQGEIEKCIESLPAELFKPFQMYQQGFRYKEIAENMQIPIGTVKSRIFLARKKLVAMLADYR